MDFDNDFEDDFNKDVDVRLNDTLIILGLLYTMFYTI